LFLERKIAVYPTVFSVIYASSYLSGKLDSGKNSRCCGCGGGGGGAARRERLRLKMI
jgi:hypothetical protein